MRSPVDQANLRRLICSLPIYYFSCYYIFILVFLSFFVIFLVLFRNYVADKKSKRIAVVCEKRNKRRRRRAPIMAKTLFSCILFWMSVSLVLSDGLIRWVMHFWLYLFLYIFVQRRARFLFRMNSEIKRNQQIIAFQYFFVCSSLFRFDQVYAIISFRYFLHWMRSFWLCLLCDLSKRKENKEDRVHLCGFHRGDTILFNMIKLASKPVDRDCRKNALWVGLNICQTQWIYCHKYSFFAFAAIVLPFLSISISLSLNSFFHFFVLFCFELWIIVSKLICPKWPMSCGDSWNVIVWIRRTNNISLKIIMSLFLNTNKAMESSLQISTVCSLHLKLSIWIEKMQVHKSHQKIGIHTAVCIALDFNLRFTLPLPFFGILFLNGRVKSTGCESFISDE